MKSETTRRSLEEIHKTLDRLVGPAAKGDAIARAELVKACLPVLNGIVRQTGRTDISDDLVQAGQVGLLKALEKYDPEKVTERGPLPYFVQYMHGEVSRFLKRNPSHDAVPLDAVEEAAAPAPSDAATVTVPVPADLEVGQVDARVAELREITERQYAMQEEEARAELAALDAYLRVLERTKGRALLAGKRGEDELHEAQREERVTSAERAVVVGRLGRILDRRAKALVRVTRVGTAAKGRIARKRKAQGRKLKAAEIHKDPLP